MTKITFVGELLLKTQLFASYQCLDIVTFLTK